MRRRVSKAIYALRQADAVCGKEVGAKRIFKKCVCEIVRQAGGKSGRLRHPAENMFSNVHSDWGCERSNV